jgi:hypothetical protein
LYFRSVDKKVVGVFVRFRAAGCSTL